MYFPKLKCFLFLPNIHGVSFRFLILSPLIEFLHRPACTCILQGTPFILTYPMIATTTCRSSTYDRDNDNHGSENCATFWGGGWWFNACFDAALTVREGSYRWTHDIWSLRESMMMVRRTAPCATKQSYLQVKTPYRTRFVTVFNRVYGFYV